MNINEIECKQKVYSKEKHHFNYTACMYLQTFAVKSGAHFRDLASLLHHEHRILRCFQQSFERIIGLFVTLNFKDHN